MPYFALLDDALRNRARLYHNHLHSQFLTADRLDSLDSCLQDGWRQGRHVVVCADYEFGLPLLGLPAPKPGYLALHWFADCAEIDSPEAWLQSRYDADAPAGIAAPQSDTAEAHYLHAVAAVRAAIGRGETYQINYTTRLHLQSYGNPVKLYHRLRQPVPYGALAHLPDAAAQARWTLCFSPELFLDITADGLIKTEPMKGTAPVLQDGGDEARAAALQNDPKNRAENVMIVDLLRNDLGKIAVTGSVRVPEPFKVSRFGSVWQMTSAVEARVRPGIRAADIFRAAFPCGSITGAPKRMSMQIIDTLESAPRGLYTGSIGWLAPCGSGLGFHGCLNVVIRTLQLTPRSDGLYQGVYGVGSGIVADSVAADEFTECRWKAGFLNRLAPEFGLFETLRVQHKTCALQALHLARLQQSAAALNLPFPDDAESVLNNYLDALPDGRLYRVRIGLAASTASSAHDSGNSGLSFAHSPCEDLNAPQYALLATQTLPRRDHLRRFKTTRRAQYDHGWQNAERQGAFDSLFFNSDGHLLEGGRSNVFVRFGNEWHTPPLALDILNGVMRQHILLHPQAFLHTDTVHESRITRTQLLQADEIRLCNALRGLFAVSLRQLESGKA
ncbi:MAG: bifunctional anthranilate synthase component I family protein/class IV aminotransferase [Neisseria sp.]|nr:bifunctional anthranilate synthase component I family protein/class IV aminotransferase [Neisseria sp.]